MRLIRWKAVSALLLFVLLFAVLWALFADRLIRDSAEEAASQSLGTEVDIGRFRILETQAAVEMGAFQLADPFDPGRNLLEFDSLRLKLDPRPIIDLKLVIDRASLTGVRFNVPRRTPARAYERGLAQNVMSTVRDFTRQFDVPPLSLLPTDTIRAVIADPSQLKSVQAASALAVRADSGRALLDRQYQGLRLQQALDSAKALDARLAQVNVRDLAAARTAISDLRRGIDSLDQAKARVADLGRAARAQVDSLNLGLGLLEQARQQDYAFARSLLKLPSFSGPDLSRALFGKISIERFQQALYWSAMARKYAPPGLLPRERPGPSRLRRAGTTVNFPIVADLPGFLVRHAELAVSAGGAESRAAAFRLTAADLTDDPTLTRQPMTFGGVGRLGTIAPMQVELGGMLDHATARMRDSVSATVRGVPLPAFKVPGLPFTAGLARGRVGFGLQLDGDKLDGRWSIATDSVRFRPDSGRALTPKEQLVARVLGGVKGLDVRAHLGGTLTAPTLEISSNLGDALAAQMKAILGEEAARAEAQVRADVDRQIGPKIAATRERVTQVQAEATARLNAAQAQLDAQKKALQERLSGIHLPGGLHL
jgi:uncharacterized protein (TIGR03545 family)